MVSWEQGWFRDGLSQFAFNLAVRGTDWALQVPFLRQFVADRVVEKLARSYESYQPPETLVHNRWFGEHLEAFLRRLIDERPAAARAILRFLVTWSQDMSRRSAGKTAGLATPCTVVIEPTDRCNLHCPGCYADSGRDGNDLPYERLEQIVRQVVDMGVTLVTLSGGEPFFREEQDRAITRLAERFPERGFLVYTNGTMIDEEIADRLAAVGNVFPAISVEGFEHQTDTRRGAGIYQRNRRVRETLGDRGVMCGFSATITRENAEAICTDEFLELRIAEGDLFGWFFLLQPIGRSPRADLMVTAEQRAMLRETINRWRSENRPMFLGDFWNDGPLVGGCLAGGRYYFHIYANGDISPCVFSPVVCGNVFDIADGRTPYADLADFVQSNPVFRAYREQQRRITDRARPCVLIDHPEIFRDLSALPDCRPAKNMPPDYLEGGIAEHIQRIAADWKQTAATLPPLGEVRTSGADASPAESPAGSE